MNEKEINNLRVIQRRLEDVITGLSDARFALADVETNIAMCKNETLLLMGWCDDVLRQHGVEKRSRAGEMVDDYSRHIDPSGS